MKTEFSEISNEVRNSSSKGGAGFSAILLLLLACGGIGFLIAEFFQPKYTILAKQNHNINPLTKEDVSNAVKNNLDNLESKLKEHINNIDEQIKTNNKENAKAISNNFNTSLEVKKTSDAKSFKSLKEQQKQFSDLIEEGVSKELKSLNKEIKELKATLKRTLETSIQLKPGNSKIINDSNE